MIVVSDTSPLLALFYLKKLEILQFLYQEIIIPEAVLFELNRSKLSEEEKKQFTSRPYRVVAVNKNQEVNSLLNKIQIGEAEAIVLSEQLHADLLLIDENIGREIAKQRGLKIIGVLGILIEAKRKQHILLVKPLIDQLISEINFRISDVLYFEVLKKCGEL
jgi:predicted nucleic acid-binding protein